MTTVQNLIIPNSFNIALVVSPLKKEKKSFIFFFPSNNDALGKSVEKKSEKERMYSAEEKSLKRIVRNVKQNDTTDLNTQQTPMISGDGTEET